MSVLAEVDPALAELEQRVFDNPDEWNALCDAATEPRPEKPNPSVAYFEPPPRPAFDFEAYRFGRELERQMRERRQRRAAMGSTELTALRHGQRAAMQAPTPTVARSPRPRGQRFRRVVRRIARRSARSPDPSEPDPPLGGSVDSPEASA